ncbi:ferredoxin [Actinomadura sp. WAC 06369]|uniref:ferredoxin n=1 Tax=Actinomadura sp. WAC 06369 TaxID=2203193 RepID=UPI000F76BA94|nr:ferredoxin [Actinomadura sp. WAC 06369]RSN66790.1 ferredoxin [Actinomadura sp. WAC 06369]
MTDRADTDPTDTDRTEAAAIWVTPETCAGTGMCGFYAPDTFGLDDDGRVTILDERGDPPADVRNAAEACPTRSIRLRP